ncbi:MAG: hypothetical protein NTX73_13730 [Rhodobacterales bacterium]|nr:hypothetical protein [Rhodobacterales bacterium]
MEDTLQNIKNYKSRIQLPLPVLFLAVGLAVAGCDTVPASSGTTCTSREACSAANYMATASKANIGMDFGGGMVLTAVQVIGQTVVEDYVVPATSQELGVGLMPQMDDRYDAFINDAVTLGMCTPDPAGYSAAPYFATGARYRARVITRDGIVIADATLDSCP